MAKINEIDFDRNSNTAWMDTCDGSIDYFPNYTGTLKYIISRVNECGSDVIHVKHEGEGSYVKSRINKICKQCGYTAIDKSHIEKQRSGIIEAGEFMILDVFVQEFELIKNN